MMLDMLGSPFDYISMNMAPTELKNQGTDSDFTETKSYKMGVGTSKMVQQVKALDAIADDLH